MQFFGEETVQFFQVVWFVIQLIFGSILEIFQLA